MNEPVGCNLEGKRGGGIVARVGVKNEIAIVRQTINKTSFEQTRPSLTFFSCRNEETGLRREVVLLDHHTAS